MLHTQDVHMLNLSKVNSRLARHERRWVLALLSPWVHGRGSMSAGNAHGSQACWRPSMRTCTCASSACLLPCRRCTAICMGTSSCANRAVHRPVP